MTFCGLMDKNDRSLQPRGSGVACFHHSALFRSGRLVVVMMPLRFLDGCISLRVRCLPRQLDGEAQERQMPCAAKDTL